MALFGSSVLGFLLAIAILVTIHEFGHYLAARWLGVTVVRFSVGFGPVLFRWMGKRSIFKGTEFAISVLPLGGYVRMVDTRDPDFANAAGYARHQAFNLQALWKRSVIVFAGPLANFLLAIVLYTAAFAMPERDLKAVLATPEPDTPAAAAGVRGGERIVRIDGHEVGHWSDVRWELLTHLFSDEMRVDADDRGVTRTFTLARGELRRDAGDSVGARLGGWGLNFDQPARIGRVVEGGPASRAGLQSGDEIAAIDGKSIRQWNQLTKAVVQNPNTPLSLTVRRAGSLVEVAVTPRAEPVPASVRFIGRIDVSAAPATTLGADWIVERQRDVSDAVSEGLRRTKDATMLTARVLWGMVTGEISLRQISGPVTMAEGAGATLNQGLVPFTLFLAIVSISIGVLNLLPVPMLDGGQLLYHLFEAIKGAPLSERAEALGQRIGIGFVTALTALALYNDFLRILS